MAISLIQRNFAAGELDPKLHGKVDQVKYQTGVKNARNMQVMKGGGLQSRQPTKFVCEVKNSTKAVRLIPFKFSLSQKFMLEFGDQYVRFIKNGAQVTDVTRTITNVTSANPGVFTSAAHGFTTGQEVIIDAINGMTHLNTRNFKVVVTGANTFTLNYMNGTPVDTTTFGAYVSGGTASRVYEISSPYLEADLPALKFAQSADVVSLAHPSYPPYDLKRFGDANWTLTGVEFYPAYTPGNAAATATGAAGAVSTSYLVTSVSQLTGEESLPIPYFAGPVATITAISNAFPASVTMSAAHGMVTGTYLRMNLAFNNGMRELQKRTLRITVTGANTFTLDGIDTTSSGAYTAGTDTVTVVSVPFAFATPTPAAPNTVTVFSLDPNAREYNVYKLIDGVFGLIGITKNALQDIGQEPDTSVTPPDAFNPFYKAGLYPSTVGYSKQRRFYGGSNTFPEDIYGSRIGEYYAFYQRSPIQDDDAVHFKLAGNEVNPVKHIFEVGKPLVATESGEWKLNGDGSGAIAPGVVNPEQNSYNGSSDLRPLIIDSDAIYMQAFGSIVRSFAFEFQVDGYRGNDLTAFAAHLFENNMIVDWDYVKIPNSNVFMVRNDGKMICMTFIREQAILGFCPFDFDDADAENVACIPGDEETEAYIVLHMAIDGDEKRYIVRTGTRKIDDIIDNYFSDLTLSYDGRNTGSTSMTISTAGGYTTNDALTLTSSASFFNSNDVGNEIHFYDDDGYIKFRFIIDGYTSATVVTGHGSIAVPAELQAVADTSWGKAIDEIVNLYHLEGREVSVFADRNVIASPYNDDYGTPLVVTDGAITLPSPQAVIHVGLPYVCDVEPLEVDTAQGETISAKQKLTGRVTGRFYKTRGVFIGTKEPAANQTNKLLGLTKLKIRENEGYHKPTDLLTGKSTLNIESAWNPTGSVFIRQVDPIPMTLLSITAEGLYPFKGGA